MIDVNLINEFVVTFAGFLSALSIIGGAFYKWVWKKAVKKREDREEERHQQMVEVAEKQNRPISEEVQLLAEQSKRHDDMDKKLEEIAQQNVAIIKEMREEFREHNRHADERDRLIAQNAELIKRHEDQFDSHDKRLDNHHDRLIVLEVKNGVRKVTYREGNED